MDSLITAAALSLAKGDPLTALKRVALRQDAPALALRGIAMAQLGELVLARTLLKSAVSAFGPKEVLARARCIIAEAEIAFVTRDLTWSEKYIDAAQKTLIEHGDHINAAHAHYLRIRRKLLLGYLDEAEIALAEIPPTRLPPALRAVHELAVAGIAIRRLHTKQARRALTRARDSAEQSGIPALLAEADNAAKVLHQPAARLISGDKERYLRLDEIERLFASKTLIVDEFRYAVCDEGMYISLAKRPVLFTLVREFGEAWPQDVPREQLIRRVFRSRHNDDSLRARLRVEISRLRSELRTVASINSTKRGFVLVPRYAQEVAVLEHPIREKHAAILAHLADGEAWPTSALALALHVSQRTVQRELNSLHSTGKVQALGHGRSRRWVLQPIPGFATTLLLPTTLPSD